MENKKPSKNIRKTILYIIILFAVILSGLYVIGSSDYGYSDDQMEILEKLGKPDSFILTLSEDRYEEWNFNKGGLMVGFYNGILTTFDEIEPVPDNAVSASYDPDQFDEDMKWADIKGELEGNTWVKASDSMPELFSDTDVDLYYSDQIVIGVENSTNNVVYVETMLFLPEPEELE